MNTSFESLTKVMGDDENRKPNYYQHRMKKTNFDCFLSVFEAKRKMI